MITHTNQDECEEVTFQVNVYSPIKCLSVSLLRVIGLKETDGCGPTVSSQLSVAEPVHVLDVRREFVMHHRLVFLGSWFSLKGKQLERTETFGYTQMHLNKIAALLWGSFSAKSNAVTDQKISIHQNVFGDFRASRESRERTEDQRPRSGSSFTNAFNFIVFHQALS